MFWFAPFIFEALTAVVAGGIAGAVIGIIIDELITPETIRDTVNGEKLELPDAFKYKLHEAKSRSVSVGIYNKKSELLTTINLESEKGVSKKIQVNKWEYI